MLYPIPFDKIQELDSKDLIRKYKIRSKLANEIKRTKLIKRTDLLDNENITKVANADELFLLLKPSRLIPDKPQKELVVKSVSTTYKGFILIMRDLKGGRHRASIEDGRGELISADITPNNRAKIKFSSVRILGYDLSELMILEETEKIKGLHRLDSVRGTSIGDFWCEKDIKLACFDNPIVFQSLSALLNTVLYLTCPNSDSEIENENTGSGGNSEIVITPYSIDHSDNTSTNEEGMECGPGTGWLATLVPELNIHDCCVNHDKCYQEGGDSCDKARCDYNFYKCILPKAGPAIAVLYYDAVTAFGQASFNYHDGKKGLGGTIAVGAGIGIGVVVGFALGPFWGVGVGVAAALVAIGLNFMLCNICEKVKKWECTAWEERRYRKCAEKKERRKKKCRKWKKIFRWFCKAFTYIFYFVCVVWTWIIHKICRAGKWVITGLTC